MFFSWGCGLDIGRYILQLSLMGTAYIRFLIVGNLLPFCVVSFSRADVMVRGDELPGRVARARVVQGCHVLDSRQDMIVLPELGVHCCSNNVRCDTDRRDACGRT